ncbi:MAG TPA: condensation domain-containing protein [Pyrinomonadaceae bacterium]
MSSSLSASLSKSLKQVGQLSAEKRKLLEALLKEQGIDPLQVLPIPRRRDSRSGPLSFAQQRLWLVERFTPGGGFYNIPSGMRFEGRVNVLTVEQTLNEIVRRHEILRTAIQVIDGQPLQIIETELRPDFSYVDLSTLDESVKKTVAERVIREQTQKLFDPSRGSMLRATLVALGPSDHLMVIILHHLVTDAWSNSLLISEMGQLYQSFRQGLPSALPELPVQYADYAEWQRQWEQHETLDAQLHYWTTQLAGAPRRLELPTDHPHPPFRTFRREHRAFTWPLELSTAINALGRTENVTLFMILLAAYQVLLHRYTGQGRISVGSPVANRRRSETRSLIGCFINIVVLCTDLQGNPTFRELLQRVREVTLGAYAHQDVHFEQLVKALQPERDPTHTPLVQATFTLQNVPLESPQMSGLTFRPVDVGIPAVEHDMSLIMDSRENILSGVLVYNSDLFEAGTIDRMLIHLRATLEQATSDPDIAILRIDLPGSSATAGGEQNNRQTSDEAEEFVFGT